jgi:lipopolysaccharide/colanic/teichoic acid biosynthesis glycosyltransferase
MQPPHTNDEDIFVSLQRLANGIDLHHLSINHLLRADISVLDEESFRRMISLERKRSERSRKPFLLMLVYTRNDSGETTTTLLLNTASTLLASTRETDVIGWYKDSSIIGGMFTELAMADRESILSVMFTRISGTLKDALTCEQFNQINLSFHFFPDDMDPADSMRRSDPTLYPDLLKRDQLQRPIRAVKRVMDILGSAAALVLFSPAFLLLALLVKLTSKGPVLFQQVRIGQYGKPFVLLKFRSMLAENDASIHQEYVKQLIAGKAERQFSNNNGDGAYKLTNDPRITRMGTFLRRTSLDELPQLFNVLKGEMSLVGPRPPVPYEVQSYDLWHRRRLLEAKPGITGLWQVNGRSRVKFDDMVRLDLRYARTWTPWLDLTILLRTPAAVVLGDGAH